MQRPAAHQLPAARPRHPRHRADITGIYRTIHQGLLQLRGNGDLNLVIPTGVGATFGTFTVDNGAVTVRTDNCGDQVGS